MKQIKKNAIQQFDRVPSSHDEHTANEQQKQAFTGI